LSLLLVEHGHPCHRPGRTVVIGAIIIAFIVEVARGHDVRRNRGSARSAAWRT
jgi:hypothetical protein